MIIARVIFFILAVLCGIAKFFNWTVGGTRNGNAWSLDLTMGFFLFGGLALAPWPTL
jgi:hypothetical protein